MSFIEERWRDFEDSFGSKTVRVYNRAPDINLLFDQEEHVIKTSKGTIHVFCRLETIGNDILAILTYTTANAEHDRNFVDNQGYEAMQYLAHALRDKHTWMMEDDK